MGLKNTIKYQKASRQVLVITGLVAVATLLPACSSISYSPSLIGAQTFQDESLGDEDRLFAKKKRFEKINLPAPLITGSEKQEANARKQDVVINMILDDMRRKSYGNSMKN